MSKTYAVTGWRVGWTVAPPELTAAIRKVHDFLTIAAPAPLQAAGVAAMGLPATYYARARRRLPGAARPALRALEDSGSGCAAPTAPTTSCATSPARPDGDGVAFACRLITEIGVSCVPAVSFWRPENAGGPEQGAFRVPEAPGDPARRPRAAGGLGCRLRCFTGGPSRAPTARYCRRCDRGPCGR